MEEIIKNIVNADRKARDKVRLIENECAQLPETLQKQRVKINEEQQQIAEQKRTEYKQLLEKELAKSQQKNDEEYEKTYQTLEALFVEEKDKWIDEIYHRCLKA